MSRHRHSGAQKAKRPICANSAMLSERPRARPPSGHGGTTSNLSLDEILLLHSVGLEPVHVVFGVGCISIMTGVWNWSTGPVLDAHDAFHRALDQAKESIRGHTEGANGIGVLGVEVEVQLSPHRSMVAITGTAVRPYTDESGQSHFNVKYRTPFLCDLSARDFVVLELFGVVPARAGGRRVVRTCASSHA